MKKQDISGNRVNIVFLGVGSNLGNKHLNIEKAKFLLDSNDIKVIKFSNYYETESWPDKNLPKYLNIIKDDLKEMMQYKKGSTQYLDKTLKIAENIRLYQ